MSLKRKLLYIRWLDHCSFEEAHWRKEEEYDELNPATCHTIGWVLKETDKHIIVIQTIHLDPEDDDFEETEKFNGDMCIIKGCIEEMKEVKL